MGNFTTSQPFSKVLGGGSRRATLVASYGVSLCERKLIPKTLVLPLLLSTGQAYRATEQEEWSLKDLFPTALGFHSWGITHTHSSLLQEAGGFAFHPMTHGSEYNRGLAFMAVAHDQTIKPCFICRNFRACCHRVWCPLDVPVSSLSPTWTGPQCHKEVSRTIS